MNRISLKSTFVLPVVILAAVALSACSLSTQQTVVPSPSAAAMVVAPSPMMAQESVTTPVETDNTKMMMATTAAGETFNQSVFYNNPAGGDMVRFSMTVDQAGTITAVETEVKAVNQVSVGLQNKFKDAVGNAVVGKKLSELKVDRIGGASLTTGAFKKFLTEAQT